MTDPNALIGSTLGRYELRSLLGSGGMASVYQALDQQLQRPVAVKVLAPALAAEPDYVARFRREAQLIANLRHPNVVRIYAFGEHRGALFMVQELLPGPTIERRIAEARTSGGLPRDAILGVVADLAAALDAAHAVGVIHRDVKPSNAIADAQGRTVLTDFGIARGAADQVHTAAGVLMGTPGYVAPEQAVSSVALTPACDIYALGVVAFELLTGRRPFEADTPTGVVLKHLYEAPPPPSRLRPDAPPALDAAVLRSLEKEPAARFASAGAFAQALAAAWPAERPAPATIHSRPTSAWAGRPAPAAPGAPPTPVSLTSPPPARPRRAAWLLPVLAAALLIALAAAALLAARPPGAAPSAAPTPAAASAAAAPALPTPAAAPVVATPAASTPAPVVATPTVAPADPLADLGVLISAGLNDGSAGADAPEYAQRYGYLAEAVAGGDDQRAAEEIRELSRKIAERAREGKLDRDFNTRAQTLLLAVAEQHGLPPPPGDGDDG